MHVGRDWPEWPARLTISIYFFVKDIFQQMVRLHAASHAKYIFDEIFVYCMNICHYFALVPNIYLITYLILLVRLGREDNQVD